MPNRAMKCLSVRQPWASLIVGIDHHLDLPKIKDVENRTWSTKYRGDLLIHASQTPDTVSLETLFPPWPGLRFDMPRGMIIGVVKLVDVVADYVSPWAFEGQWHWVLEKPRRFYNPIIWRGQLGLYDVPMCPILERVLAESTAI